MPTLNWIGKDKVISHHQDVPYRVLEHKYGFTAKKGEQTDSTQSGNKIIQGDNLVALKSLLPEYEGKIKSIYIDPPYNTGNENWVYNDNVNHPKIKKWLGEVVGKEGDDLSRHDKWLCMMYPRLQLLRKLLHKKGVLCISIGHHEISNLTAICKELFNDRQIFYITVQTSGGKPSRGFNVQHEYVIFITPKDFTPNKILHSGGNSRSPFEGLTLATFNKKQRPNQTYPIFINKSNGNLHSVGMSLQERINKGLFKDDIDLFKYDFNEAPEGTIAVWPITSKGKECVWRLIGTRLESDWKKGYIKISPNKSKKSLNKFSVQYLPSGLIKKIESGILSVVGKEDGKPTLIFGENTTEGSQIPTIWIEKEFYTVKGTTQIKEIFGKSPFDYPKALEFICEILRATSNKSSIILDSFAGSGTTAHAVLKLNEQDGGNRKFILVEMEEYANNVTAERIKRVTKGYGKESNKVEGTDGAFDFYELGLPLFDKNQNLNEKVGIEKIRQYIWFSETRTHFKEKEVTNYFLGKKDDSVYYFIYEKDKLTTLDFDALELIKTKGEQYVIYADNCLLPIDFMAKNNIIFKKIPRDITRF